MPLDYAFWLETKAASKREGTVVLSIGAMGGGQGEYYIGLGREDYYTEGGEPPGKWFGRGAEDLRLRGIVDPDAFRNLLEGCSPKGAPLIQNAGEKDHQPGWDLTFSAPKSVSVIWSQADSQTRKEIQNCHEAAVKKAIEYLEDTAGFTRRGKGGITVEQAKLIVATFEHGTSRAQDPQLHTHAIVINVGVRRDGTTGTILSKPLYQAKMATGAVYRAELAHQLEQRLSLIAERTGRTFEICGVDKGLVAEFSKRREEILAALEAKGFSGAKAAAAATLTTREVKGHIAREELFTLWHGSGIERGFSLDEVRGLTEARRPQRNFEREKKEAIAEALSKITETQSHFSERDLVRHAAEAGQGRGLGADQVIAGVKAKLQDFREIVPLGRPAGERRYTTREMLELETKMLGLVEGSRRVSFPLKDDAVIAGTLSDEQKRALHHITETRGGIKVISGMAGTGKTTLLDAAREVWEASGYEVRGAALSGKAAQGLEEGAKIKSETIHKTLGDIERGNTRISSNTILVVDEAGMVGTRQMERLISEVRRGGGKLILVGDAKQLQPIEAGGPFHAIADRIGAAELTDIRRQRDERDRQAIKNIAAGESKKALHSYAERGLLTVAEDRRGAMESLISDWKSGAAKRPEEALIITGTRLEASALNRRAQEERKLDGGLGKRSITVEGVKLYENDRVLFTKNSRLYGVKNGSLGTIEAVDERNEVIKAKLDSGGRVIISTRQYPNLQLGYAITTHKGQGATVEKSFVLSGGEMLDRELAYVQSSRARGETRIYTDRHEAGDLIASLAKQMNKSRQKDLAVDIAADHERERERERQKSLTL